ncbi:MAG TPA: nuclear transport factor 2 family protein [Bryobacteraceae bacterium]|nr:nuclear transport factor 2 family protein [Bryobacteraceae bacterium]
MTTAVTKTIQIARSAAESYDFLADPATMPQWAIHNVMAIRDLGNGRWEMDTPRGKGTLIPHYEKPGGILDHEFVDANEGRWRVTARIVPVAPSESVYIITLPKPDTLPAEMFETGMRLMDDEMAALKACIESLPTAGAPRQVVEALYEGFRQRDMAKVFSLLAPDVEFLQSEDLPWGGVYRGHEGAREFFGRLLSHVRSAVSIERLVAAGDQVAAVGWTEGSVNATGAAFRVPVVHLWRVRAGKIVGAQFCIDHPEMFQALAAHS